MWRSTCAGGKIPLNADQLVQKVCLQMVYCVKDEHIPSELIANSDQTQMPLAQGSMMTYAAKGSKQVSSSGSEEKRVITVMVMLTNSGKVLPFQAIYKGSTPGLLPRKGAPAVAKALEEGFLLESLMTGTYWSTQKTMRNFVNQMLAPYFKTTKILLGLPPDQWSMWLIDCWLVHRSDELLDWMKKYHKAIIVNFVPAQMTGLFQPCDVGFQWIFKLSLKKSANKDVIKEVFAKLQAGTAVEEIIIDAHIKPVCDCTVCWM
jgi:hypothetical protein